MKSIRFAVVLTILFAGVPALAAGTSAGEVLTLRGPVTVTQDGKTTKLYRGASVIAGDQLRTGRNARLKLRMIDGAEITLGENSEFFVREYEMRAAEGAGVAVLEVTKGFFRAVTGRITKLRENKFQVKTPLAVIGVRGTDFWGEQHPNKLRIAMLDGTAVTVTNDYGSVEITEAGFGTEITAANQPPRAPFRWSPEEIAKAAGTVD
jgi:hypothetical protein